MKKMVLLLFLLGIFLISLGQTHRLKGVVLDIYLHQPIPAALISVNGKAVGHTNEDGVFQMILKQKKGNQLLITASGYASKIILPEIAESIIVELEPVNYQTSSIQVQGLYNGTNLLNSPGSIGNLVPRDFQRNNLINFSNTFNLIPGARMEFRNTSTGARIILRGYGNQNNTSGIGYKAYYNDIPLTDADGTTVLDDVDFATLGRVEVFKGPVSSVYGSGIGGVVNMLTEKAPDGITVRQSAMQGSSGLLRVATSVGVGDEKENILMNYGMQKTDGWRLNDDSKKNFWNINASIYNNAKSTFTVFAAYTQSFDKIPGLVDSFGLIHYPDTAELTNIKNLSRNELESFRVGLTHEYHFSEKFSNKTTFFTGSQETGQWLSTILTKTNKNILGARTAFNLEVPIGNVDAKFTLGTEVIKNIIYQKSYNLTNGVLGTLRTDQESKPMQWNAFAKIELTLTKKTLMVFSTAANFVMYDNVDLVKTGGGYINQTGFKRFTPLLTPRWVINHLISKHVSVYSNYSMGFGQPSTNQVIIAQTGKVNTNIKPEISNTFEVGGKASLFKESLYMDFAYYNMEVSDKIVTQSFAAAGPVPAYTAFVNAGTVDLVGVEFSMNYVYKPKQKGFLQLMRPFLNYQNNSSKNIDLKSDNNNNAATKDYSNLRVSGLPRNILSTGIDIEAGNGFYLNLTDMYSDHMPITLDNSVNADSYNLVNMKAGYRREFGGGRSDKYGVDLFWGMNNMFDTRYAQFVVINLVPVNGVAPKFFSPGPPSALYAGISFRYKFK
jgi:iron complex outermembrane receptor protein